MRWQYLTRLPGSSLIFNFWMVPVAIFKIGVQQPRNTKWTNKKRQSGKTSHLSHPHTTQTLHTSCPLGPHTLQLLLRPPTRERNWWLLGLRGSDRMGWIGWTPLRCRQGISYSFDDTFKEFVWICETWFDWPAYDFFFFLSFICCGTVAYVAKINFWATKLEFGERLQDVSAFIQMQLAVCCYQKMVLLDGEMRVLRCLKRRSFFAFEFRIWITWWTHDTAGWNQSSESGKCGAFMHFDMWSL